MFAQQPPPDFDVPGRREPGERPGLVAELSLVEVACATGEVAPVDRSGSWLMATSKLFPSIDSSVVPALKHRLHSSQRLVDRIERGGPCDRRALPDGLSVPGRGNCGNLGTLYTPLARARGVREKGCRSCRRCRASHGERSFSTPGRRGSCPPRRGRPRSRPEGGPDARGEGLLGDGHPPVPPAPLPVRLIEPGPRDRELHVESHASSRCIHPGRARYFVHSLRTTSCGIFAGYPGFESPFNASAATAPWRRPAGSHL